MCVRGYVRVCVCVCRYGRSGVHACVFASVSVFIRACVCVCERACLCLLVFVSVRVCV